MSWWIYNSQNVWWSCWWFCSSIETFPIGLFQVKWLKNIFTAFYIDENILYFNGGSGDAVLNCSGMGVFNMDLNNINIDDKFD